MTLEDLEPENMLNDLLSGYLEVVLTPAPVQMHSGHCVRRVQYQNCFWYRKFCAAFPSSAKYARRRSKHIQTQIHRRQVIEALQAIVNGQRQTRQNCGNFPILPQPKTEYQKRILEFIECEKERLKTNLIYRLAAATAARCETEILLF